MPGKNKPKRLDRNRSWRVARRKKRIAKLVNGNSRNRNPRPKNKGRVAEEVKTPAEKPEASVDKKVEKKVVEKAAEKEE
jgi:hypothetical protein